MLDRFTELALLCAGVDGDEVDEERLLDSRLLSITRELRMRPEACTPRRCSERLLLLCPDLRAFSSSHSATSRPLACSSGSQVFGQSLPVSGSVPFHLIWYFLIPRTTFSSRIQSASQILGLSLASLSLDSLYLDRLFGFVLVGFRFLLGRAITRNVRCCWGLGGLQPL